MISVKKQWPLLLACSVALISVEQTGVIAGWSSPILARLQNENSTIPVTSDEGSWIATIVSTVSIFVTPIAAIIIERYGRKVCIVISVLPYVISWIVIGMSTSVQQLIIGRAISGLGLPFSLSAVPIYLGEIATDDIRGAVTLFITVFSSFGTLRMYSTGILQELWQSSLLAALPLIVIIIFWPWLPESSYYLIQKNRREEAIRELVKIRHCKNVEEEIKKIEVTVAENMKKNMFTELISEPCHRRALMVCMGVITIHQCTGGMALVFFLHLILQRAGDISTDILSIIKATLQLMMSVGAAYFVDSLGRRPLLIISCIGSSIFMTCVGIYFYLQDYGYNVDNIWWLPLISILLFNMSQVIGLTSISLAYFGELFHPKVKPLTVCICKTYLSVLFLIVGKCFQIFTDSFGNCVPFFIFALVGLAGVLFVWFYVPETKGKSLDDIQYYFKHKTYRR